jgi:hypothetical protein
MGPFLVCLVTAPLLHLFLYRYLLFTLPAWCLLAAMVVVAALRGDGFRSWPRRWFWSGSAAWPCPACAPNRRSHPRTVEDATASPVAIRR